MVNGTAVVALDPVDNNITVVVDGKAYPAELVNGTASVTTDPVVVPVASEFSDIVIDENMNISFVLKDANGNAIANVPITYTVNGIANTTTTSADGSFVIAGDKGVTIVVSYEGNENVSATNTSLKFTAQDVPTVVKIQAFFENITDPITITGYAVDTKAGEQGMLYSTVLVDDKGNPIAGVPIQFAVNNKIYNRTTFENGSFNPYHLDMIRAGRYTMAFYFPGNDNYTTAFGSVCIDLDLKPITIKASAKTYKASVKTKKYSATLSTIVGSSLDGKAHLRTGLKVTLTVNGKTFNGKTDANGKVTFKITNLNKKGKYTAKISYAGDKTYDKANKSVKLTIK